MHTKVVDTVLRRAADHAGLGPFSDQLEAIAEAWTADKAAAACAPNVAETQAALLRAGRLRIRQAAVVVAAAAAPLS